MRLLSVHAMQCVHQFPVAEECAVSSVCEAFIDCREQLGANRKLFQLLSSGNGSRVLWLLFTQVKIQIWQDFWFSSENVSSSCVACLLDDFGLFVHCVQDVSLVPLLVERKGNLWIKESNSFVSKRNLGIKDGFPSKSSNLATLYGFVLWILAPPTPTPPTSDFSLSDNNAKLGSVYPLTSSKGKCVHYLGKQVLITRRQGRRFNGLTRLVGCKGDLSVSIVKRE